MSRAVDNLHTDCASYKPVQAQFVRFFPCSDPQNHATHQPGAEPTPTTFTPAGALTPSSAFRDCTVTSALTWYFHTTVRAIKENANFRSQLYRLLPVWAQPSFWSTREQDNSSGGGNQTCARGDGRNGYGNYLGHSCSNRASCHFFVCVVARSFSTGSHSSCRCFSGTGGFYCCDRDKS